MIMDDKWGYPHLWKHPNDKAWEKSALTQVFFTNPLEPDRFGARVGHSKGTVDDATIP